MSSTSHRGPGRLALGSVRARAWAEVGASRLVAAGVRPTFSPVQDSLRAQGTPRRCCSAARVEGALGSARHEARLRQLGLGVELEFALRPAERADDGIVARFAIALGVEEMAEQEVKRGRLTVAISEGKGTCRPLALGRFQKRA